MEFIARQKQKIEAYDKAISRMITERGSEPLRSETETGIVYHVEYEKMRKLEYDIVVTKRDRATCEQTIIDAEK